MEKPETKICKYCGTEIPYIAKVCPNCRKKQGGKLKWIIIAVVVILVIGAAAGGGDDDNDVASDKNPKKVSSNNTDSTNKEKQSDNEEQSEQEENKQFIAGDTVETSDLKITFTKAGKYKSDNQFLQPEKGNIYYRGQFEFENISDSDQTISSMMDWEFYADGYSMKQSWIEDDQIDATLSPGKKVKGSVYFEVPKGSEEILIEYKTNFWNSDRVTFKAK